MQSSHWWITWRTDVVFWMMYLAISSFSVMAKEHKVHNIVLYPDKHSWCKVTAIKQVISHPGCQSKSIDNNVCVGTCFSFSVPKTIPETPGDEQLHYCDSCQSSDSMWITVSLDCPDNPNTENGESSSHGGIQNNKVEKSVEIIGNCSCTSCREKGASHQLDNPRVTTEDDGAVEYEEEEAENLKQMYDIMALQLAAARNAHAHGNSATGHQRDAGKHLALLEADGDVSEDSEGPALDDEVIRRVKALGEVNHSDDNSTSLWVTLKAALTAFLKLL